MTLDVLRQAWPGVVEAIKAKGRVAAMVIGNASVASFDEGVLTLRFPRQGDVKGFQGGKYEDLLKQTIASMFGINVVIRAVTGGGDAPSAGRRPGQPPAPAAPNGQQPSGHGQPPTGQPSPGQQAPGRQAPGHQAAGQPPAVPPPVAGGQVGRTGGRAVVRPGIRCGTRWRGRPAVGCSGVRHGRRHALVRWAGQRRRRPAAVAAASATG